MVSVCRLGKSDFRDRDVTRDTIRPWFPFQHAAPSFTVGLRLQRDIYILRVDDTTCRAGHGTSLLQMHTAIAIACLVESGQMVTRVDLLVGLSLAHRHAAPSSNRGCVWPCPSYCILSLSGPSFVSIPRVAETVTSRRLWQRYGRAGPLCSPCLLPPCPPWHST
jgi:hypothetical protein